MCKFFSFVTYKGKKYYFDSEARRQTGEHDSHSNICSTFLNSLIKEDKSNKYEFTSEGLIKDSIQDDEEQFDDVKDWMEQFKTTREFWKICVRSLSNGTDCLNMVPEDKRQATSDIIHEFACWSAEQVLDIYEKKYPEDDRPRQAIEAKRKWLKGEITDKKLKAASDAAGAAAWAAAWAAAAGAAAAGAAAAGAAAGAAVAGAAAAGAAAGAAAAGAAAWAAAGAAAAGAAAWAARDAEYEKQQEYLDLLMELVWPE